MLRIFSYSVSSILTVMLFGLIFIYFYINPNNYKAEINAEVSRLTGREFTIKGDVNWAFLPILGLAINDAELFNADGFYPRKMLSIKNMSLKIRLWPLLRRHIIIKELNLTNSKLKLIRKQDGVTNWQDLTKKPKKISTSDNFTTEINNVNLKQTSLEFSDRQFRKTVKVNGLGITASNIIFGKPLLSTLNANASIGIGSLTYNKFIASNILATIKMNQGNFTIKPLTAKIFKGNLKADFSYHERSGTPEFTLNEKLSKVHASAVADMFSLQSQSSLGKLSTALSKLPITGDSEITLDLKGKGRLSKTILQTLSGKIHFTFSRGILTGIGANDWLAKGVAELLNIKDSHLNGNMTTQFSTLSGTINIADGTATNPDFELISNHLQITGSGSFNLGLQTMKYHLKLQRIKDGKSRGAVIPFIITGDIISPRVQFDASSVIKTKLEKEKKVLGKKLQKEIDQIKNIKVKIKNPDLKKLFH